MKLIRSRVVMCCLLFFVFQPALLLAWDADLVPVATDPAIRMPGTQPDQLEFPLTGPDKAEQNGCLNCHGESQFFGPGQTQPATAGYPWIGSMMGQAARDPIFWATMTVAMQDSVWALGNANAGDLCLRCHFPEGWLGGRSGHNNSNDLNASSMTASDYDGVHCDVCHIQFDPFFEDANTGNREFMADWDENPAGLPPLFPSTFFDDAVNRTYLEDKFQATSIELFNNGTGGFGFYVYPGDGTLKPIWEQTFTENAGGQMFMSDTPGTDGIAYHSSKRGSFINGLIDPADHDDPFYSRYHKSKFFCSTCHDVSNPVFANSGIPGLTLPDQSGEEDLISEQYSAHRFGHVERTFSEFMLSAYAKPGGAPTNPEYAAGDNSANIPGVVPVTHADKCQDCHMADVVGGLPAGGSISRPTPEHPNSGSPAHDFQGGNVWMTRILASLDHESNGTATYDPVNYEILTGGDGANPPLNATANVSTHTLDVTQGVGLLSSDYMPGEALSNAADRAEYQLRQAATIKDAVYSPVTGVLTFKVQNNTGHKLISGYPEGRRMFLNIVAYDPINAVMYEINPYDAAAGTLKGLSFNYSDPDSQPLPAPLPLMANETYNDALVYEMKQSSSLTEEDKTFHFVLATARTKDNRIPPKGFNIVGAADRLIEPVWDGVVDPNYFTAVEYAEGYDEVSVMLPPGADQVDINLFYQGTSREYVEFLRDEINGTGNLTLYGPDNPADTRPTLATAGMANPDGDNAYLIQTDPFFDGLRGWGDTIWALWKHNSDLGPQRPTTKAEGLTPFLMAGASTTGVPDTALNGDIYSPVGGEIVASSDTLRIAWVPFPKAQKYKIQYSLDNQKSWKKAGIVKKAFTYSTTIYDWPVPQVSETKAECFVKVKAIAKSGKVINADISDAPFTIIPTIEFTSPMASDALAFGSNVNIRWNLNSTNPAITTIDLQYRKSPSTSWINIATNLPGATGFYPWTVPTLKKDKRKASLRIKVKNAAGKKMSLVKLPVKLVGTI